MAVVIADAGPLIALAKLEKLDLLPALFGKVLATQAVVDECSKGSGHDAVLIQEVFRTEGFRCIDTPDFKHALSRSLGVGELSCIEFALQQSAESVLLIMDDALARKQALRLQLNIVGTAALLFVAEKKGLIADAESFIELLNKSGHRISPSVVTILKKKHSSK